MTARFVCEDNKRKVVKDARGRCALCGGNAADDPHHWYRTVGSGGGDFILNLIACCRKCHQLAHAGIIALTKIAEVVGMREGLPAVRVIQKLEELHSA